MNAPFLNPEQQLAVSSDARRLVVRAGAGAGKTRVLVERIARLVEGQWHPKEVLALTFTRKAAAEMRERLEQRVPPRQARQLTITTFHAWAARILRSHADVVGLAHNFTIRDETDSNDLVLFVGRELGLQHRSVARLWKEDAVRRRYAELLREANAVDYDQLETLLVQLLTKPDRAAELRSRYRHVLVDEAQDTSEGQQRALDLLDPQHLFVVGDAAQAIYSFRGAHPEGFVGLSVRPGWATIELTTNYRSASEIVDAASAVAERMTPPGLELRTGRPNSDSDRGIVMQLEAESPEASLALVADDIAAALRGGEVPGELAVLAPTWRHLEALSTVLTERQIDHVVARRRLEVWNTDEARWLINCLRVVVNPSDHLALWAAMQAFTSRISLAGWARARAEAASKGVSVLQVLAEGGPVIFPGRDLPLGLVLQFALDLARLHDADRQPTDPHTFELVLEIMRAELKALRLPTRLARLDELERAVCAWGDNEDDGFSTQGLLDWFAGRELVDAGDQETPRLQLLTIHASKGLEFLSVWVLGCNEGELPRVRVEGPALEEQRRLFYVATTRAGNHLRWCFHREATRSRFIDEAYGRAAAAAGGAG